METTFHRCGSERGQGRRWRRPVALPLLIVVAGSLLNACGGGGSGASSGSTTSADAGVPPVVAVPTPAPDPQPPTSPAARQGLGQADFSYLGSHAIDNLDGLMVGSGLTLLRYVDSQLRFLTFSYRTGEAAVLREFALPDGSDGRAPQGSANAAIMRTTASWPDIWSPFTGPSVGGGDHSGLWWEAPEGSEGGSRPWTTRADDYPNDVQRSQTQAISVRELRADGTVTDRFGEYGFEGTGQRAIYGGVQPIPAWFAEQHRLRQRDVAGWGGYASRLAQGLVPSLGLMMLAIPDVTGYPMNAAGSLIPAAGFRMLADHRSGSVMANDWYSGAASPPNPPPFDRGARTPNVINHFDGGDNRPNGSTAEPSAGPPLPGAQRLGPAPDGRGRMVWNDSFHATGNWIDGEHKHGSSSC